MVPYDSRSPFTTSGIRLGTPALTSRGLKEEHMKPIVDMIDRVLSNPDSEQVAQEVKKQVYEMMHGFPLYAY